MEKLHTIIIDYIPADKLHLLECILNDTTLSELKVAMDNYVLIGTNDDENNDETSYIHMCDIVEILWDDLKSLNDKKTDKCYDELVNKYGKEMMDLLVLFDSSKIKSKLINIINTSFEAFKTDKLEIQIANRAHATHLNNLILSVLAEYYKVIEHHNLRFNYTIIIEKEGK